jgi:hypothetical protein
MTALQLLMKKDSNQTASSKSTEDIGAIDIALQALSKKLDEANKKA